MANQDKLEHWKSLLKSQEESGLLPTTWCNKNQIKRSNYYYWKQKIEEASNEQSSVAPNKSVVFAKLENKEPEVTIIHNRKLHLAWKDLQMDISSIEEISLAAELIRQLQQKC